VRWRAPARRLRHRRIEHQFGKPGQRLDILRLLGEDVRQDLRGELSVAGLARLGRGRQRLGDAGLPAILASHPLDELADLAFGNRSHEAVDRAPVLERDHGRDRLDAELTGDRRVVVDVHLHQFHPPARLAHRFLQRRGELLARTAPRRPEIDQHRLLARFLQHVLGEACRGGVADQVCRGRGADAGRRGGRGWCPGTAGGRSEGDVRGLVAA